MNGHYDCCDDDSCCGEPIDRTGHLEELDELQQLILKNVMKTHQEYAEKESEFEKELNQLVIKYSQIYAPILKKRADLVSGAVLPEDVPKEVVDAHVACADGKGLPFFWFHALYNNDTVREALQMNAEGDKECLRYLTDITCEVLPEEEAENEIIIPICGCDDEECKGEEEGCKCGGDCKCVKEGCKCAEEGCKCGEGCVCKKDKAKKITQKVKNSGFRLSFHFAEGNPFFPETVLTKTYHFQKSAMDSQPTLLSIEKFVPLICPFAGFVRNGP